MMTSAVTTDIVMVVRIRGGVTTVRALVKIASKTMVVRRRYRGKALVGFRAVLTPLVLVVPWTLLRQRQLELTKAPRITGQRKRLMTICRFHHLPHFHLLAGLRLRLPSALGSCSCP